MVKKQEVFTAIMILASEKLLERQAYRIFYRMDYEDRS